MIMEQVLEQPNTILTPLTEGMEPSNGFYDVPDDLYHSRMPDWSVTLSASIAKVLVNQSPAHAYYCHPQLGGNAKPSSKDMEIGTLAHSVIPGKGREIIVSPHDDYRTNAAKEFKSLCIASGKTPVKQSELDTANAINEAFKRQIEDCGLTSSFYSKACLTETAMYWTCEADAPHVHCQAKIDRFNPIEGLIFDVKTCGDASPDSIAKDVEKFNYDVQDCFYRRGAETLLPDFEGRMRFVFLFIEKSAPYIMTPVVLSAAGRAIGTSKVKRAMETWRKCIKRDVWPGYSDTVMQIEPTKWAETSERPYMDSTYAPKGGE